jgi:hypothetical protein
MYTPQKTTKDAAGTPGPASKASNQLQPATVVDLRPLHEFHKLHEFQIPQFANHTTPNAIAQIAQKI